MCVRAYICMYVRMYLCMYVCVRMCVYVRMNVFFIYLLSFKHAPLHCVILHAVLAYSYLLFILL
jgi:hypothetical protein